MTWCRYTPCLLAQHFFWNLLVFLASRSQFHKTNKLHPSEKNFFEILKICKLFKLNNLLHHQNKQGKIFNFVIDYFICLYSFLTEILPYLRTKNCNIFIWTSSIMKYNIWNNFRSILSWLKRICTLRERFTKLVLCLPGSWKQLESETLE